MEGGRWELGGANPPDASHLYMDLLFLSGSVKVYQHLSALAEALGCLNLSIWERCCVAAV